MLSIVIPCYNEAANIPLIAQKLSSAPLPDVEIILVDNGSTDNTPEVLRQELARVKNVSMRFVRVEKNIGYGFGIMTGVRNATGDVIAWTHADLQTDIQDIFRGYEHFCKAPDPEQTFLKGVRKNRPLLDAFFTWGMALLSSFALGSALHDINAQPKMFHRKFLELIKNPPDDFSLDLYVLFLAKINKFHFIIIPVFFGKRLHGEAKGGGSWKTKFRLIKRTLTYIFKLRQEIKIGVR
ncbi:MAG: glycosyltransferase family 2 protein [SAR324 cluster bacterium]|nr:glycosyltransferase family 2 protein [SAR324 cluster bacterium]